MFRVTRWLLVAMASSWIVGLSVVAAALEIEPFEGHCRRTDEHVLAIAVALLGLEAKLRRHAHREHTASSCAALLLLLANHHAIRIPHEGAAPLWEILAYPIVAIVIAGSRSLARAEKIS